MLKTHDFFFKYHLESCIEILAKLLTGKRFFLTSKFSRRFLDLFCLSEFIPSLKYTYTSIQYVTTSASVPTFGTGVLYKHFSAMLFK